MQAKLILVLCTMLFSLSAQAALFSHHDDKCQRSCAKPEPEFSCQCTDIGMHSNTCIDKKVYCKAFGNAGKLN